MRVLIIDDHALVLDGISSLLQAAGYDVVGQARDGQEAVRAVIRLQPDVVLLDISLPDISGLEVLSQIKAQLPEIHVAMLTASDDDSDLVGALKGGANGYILKSAKAEELLDSLSNLAKGEMALSHQIAARAVQGLMRSDSSERSPEPPLLTERETEILQLVAEGLANRAIGQQLSLSENTIKYHLKKILQKMGVQNRTEAVAAAMSLGLLRHSDE